jgi:hypothetical protein
LDPHEHVFIPEKKFSETDNVPLANMFREEHVWPIKQFLLTESELPTDPDSRTENPLLLDSPVIHDPDIIDDPTDVVLDTFREFDMKQFEAQTESPEADIWELKIFSKQLMDLSPIISLLTSKRLPITASDETEISFPINAPFGASIFFATFAESDTDRLIRAVFNATDNDRPHIIFIALSFSCTAAGPLTDNIFPTIKFDPIEDDPIKALFWIDPTCPCT